VQDDTGVSISQRIITRFLPTHCAMCGGGRNSKFKIQNSSNLSLFKKAIPKIGSVKPILAGCWAGIFGEVKTP
ncbi:MAG: hypothetical protein WCJ51_01975, partial [Candidatus Moraniibacteriota bacterium]